MTIYVLLWLFYLRYSRCHIASDESDELPGVTEVDPVISALRDVALSPDQDAFDCRQLFAGETSAHKFSMSEDFRDKVVEFLAAVNASIAGARGVEGNSFQMENEYKFIHYLTSRLDFVRTVCETGNIAMETFNKYEYRPTTDQGLADAVA